MRVYGLSQINQQIVETFDHHADIMKIIKQMSDDPSKFKKLTDDAMKAIALTDEEIIKRNEAIEQIEAARKAQKEAQLLLNEIDAKRIEAAKEHEDQMHLINDERSKNKAYFDDRKKQLDEREAKMDKSHAERDQVHAERVSTLDNFSRKLKEDEARIDRKKSDMDILWAEIEKHKAKMMA